MSAARAGAGAFFGRQSTQRRLQLGAVYLTIFFCVGVLMVPFSWMLATALKPLVQVFEYPPTWIPDPPQWRNFYDGWVTMPFTRYLANTLYIAVVAIIGMLASSSIVAYGFARLRAPGRNVLFLLVLSTMMLPQQVTLIPTFLLFKELGWLNTYKPLLVPAFTAASSPVFIFLLRQFYLTLPLELDDAARIDGCGIFGIYWRIILPLSKPALATVGIFVFFNRWNSFLWPLIYLKSPEKYTLAIGLSFFHSQQGGGLTEWNLLMAVTLLVAIPPLLVFFIAQRSFVQGIALTGIKG
jgi:ABC-type glycerol-3-phosphate transport system permease component